MHGAERLRAELLRGQLFDRFFDRPFDFEVTEASKRAFSTIFRRLEASERAFSTIFRRQEASERAFSSIFRRQEASERAFSSIFDVRRPRGQHFRPFSTPGGFGARFFEVFRAPQPRHVPTAQRLTAQFLYRF